MGAGPLPESEPVSSRTRSGIRSFRLKVSGPEEEIFLAEINLKLTKWRIFTTVNSYIKLGKFTPVIN
jgi:hypothetical protein